MRFSKKTQCFYPSDIQYPSLPIDIFDVTQADYDLAQTRKAGETLDFVGGKVVIVPAPAITLIQAQAAQTAAITQACAAAIVAGFISSSLGAVNSYPSALTDQQNVNSAALAGGSLWCKNAAGAWIFMAHTVAQAVQVQKDMAAYIQAQQGNNSTKQASIQSATTVTAVQAVAW